VAGLGRRRDDLGVIAVSKHGTAATRPGPVLADRRVEVLGGGDLKALHSRGEGALVLGLDEQMEVIALDAEVHDPEILAPRGSQRGLANCLVRRPASQAADRADDAQDDVHRVPRLQLGPRLVGRTCTRALGLATWRFATGPTLAPAPFVGRRLEHRQLLGFRRPSSLASSRTPSIRHAR
jgi:hypothetical protein